VRSIENNRPKGDMLRTDTKSKTTNTLATQHTMQISRLINVSCRNSTQGQMLTHATVNLRHAVSPCGTQGGTQQ